MKQTLMLTHNGLPPAQAEALYETPSDPIGRARASAESAIPWPGEDWQDDDSTLLPVCLTPPLPTARR